MFSKIFAVAQKYIMYVLLAIIAVLFVVAVTQYIRYLKADSVITEQNATIVEQKQAINTYQRNAEIAQATMQEQQKIKIQLSKLNQGISQMSTGKCMEGKDEEMFDAIFSSFNDGVLQTVPKSDK